MKISLYNKFISSQAIIKPYKLQFKTINTVLFSGKVLISVLGFMLGFYHFYTIWQATLAGIFGGFAIMALIESINYIIVPMSHAYLLNWYISRSRAFAINAITLGIFGLTVVAAHTYLSAEGLSEFTATLNNKTELLDNDFETKQAEITKRFEQRITFRQNEIDSIRVQRKYKGRILPDDQKTIDRLLNEITTIQNTMDAELKTLTTDREKKGTDNETTVGKLALHSFWLALFLFSSQYVISFFTVKISFSSVVADNSYQIKDVSIQQISKEIRQDMRTMVKDIAATETDAVVSEIKHETNLVRKETHERKIAASNETEVSNQNQNVVVENVNEPTGVAKVFGNRNKNVVQKHSSPIADLYSSPIGELNNSTISELNSGVNYSSINNSTNNSLNSSTNNSPIERKRIEIKFDQNNKVIFDRHPFIAKEQKDRINSKQILNCCWCGQPLDKKVTHHLYCSDGDCSEIYNAYYNKGNVFNPKLYNKYARRYK